MTEFIGELFSKLFNDNALLATILVSMVPIMELKGGIPFGMSEAFWGKNALSKTSAFWSAYLGCSIVVLALYFLFTPIMKILRKTKIFKNIANFIDNRVKKQTDKIDETKAEVQLEVQEDKIPNEDNVTQNKKHFIRKSMLKKMLGVFIFTAIPLPLTGVWMGTCISVALDLNFWETLISVELGNLVAGIIIVTICAIFPNFTHILIYIFLIIVALFIIYEIIKNIIKNKRKNI